MRPAGWMLLAALVLAGCATAQGRGARQPGRGRYLRVVTTTAELADFARVIGGAHVRVEPLLGGNVDPHEYEPTPADIEALARADVIVRNGAGLEAWFDRTVAAAKSRGSVVDASRGIPLRRGPGGALDPHVWHDPTNVKIMVSNMTRVFAAADPPHAAVYETDERGYEAQLDTLDKWIGARVATLHDKQLVTNHDAFGYYIARYGLDLVGSVIPSFDSQAELSSKQLATLVDAIRARHVKAVFSEHALPAKTAKTIAAEAGVAVVAGPDALYGDTLGPPGSDADTYLRMERHNTKEIVDHLR